MTKARSFDQNKKKFNALYKSPVQAIPSHLIVTSPNLVQIQYYYACSFQVVQGTWLKEIFDTISVHSYFGIASIEHTLKVDSHCSVIFTCACACAYTK